MPGSADYEEIRQDLLLAQDVLAGCAAKIDKAKAEEVAGEDGNFPNISWKIRTAMESLGESLGLMDMWERLRKEWHEDGEGGLGADPDSAIDEPPGSPS